MKMSTHFAVILISIFIFSCINAVVLQDENSGYSEINGLNKKLYPNNLTTLKETDEVEEHFGCKIMRDLRVESMICFDKVGTLECTRTLPVGTLVWFSCPLYYKAPNKMSMCKSDGGWTVPIKCKPECGVKSSEAIPLIMHGKGAVLGQFPWAAALYLRFDKQWSFNCGGTLIADNVVITAAHCTWNIEKESMLISLGNIPRTLPTNVNHPQVFKIKRVYILPVFREATNYYNSDIAILVLETPAQLSESILPACLPDSVGNVSVTPFTSGVVAGWGMNEKREQPESLNYMKVPIIDMVKCMKNVPKQFRKFMSFTSFCAGYINGTGACNGDSGNGLLTETDGRWVLQGVVNIVMFHLTYGTGACNGDSGNGLLTETDGRWVLQGTGACNGDSGNGLLTETDGRWVLQGTGACNGDSGNGLLTETDGRWVLQGTGACNGDSGNGLLTETDGRWVLQGTGACNGDSGNGLLTETDGRWVLQGVVSISPRRGTSRFCHPRNYSLYTKVMIYVDWILKVLAFEDIKTLQDD
ncbi:CLIP domain-containing serine protease HP8-like [Macrosteles quadrilineatus]|uniref:CLIP domain-containing serine protease HP8-like n=1 Tax=Macrosteles quadrilineatus TaxID=74068 RepID=UPI0023E2B180|nr:CLIP domain-containing serine protease HP8-like [Macrosteles quadrilineatus]